MLDVIKRAFKDGITEGDWNIARTTSGYDAGEDLASYQGKDVKFFIPDEIRMRTDIDDYARDGIAAKFFDVVKTETEFHCSFFICKR